LPALLILLAMPVPAQASPAHPARTGSSNNLKLVDVVVLVDESDSETPLKVAQEKQAAGTIAQTLLNPASRVAVVGFGGRNGVASDQNPIDVVCRPAIASPADQQYLSTCVNGLHRRTEAKGDDTDYVAALSQALSYFNPSTTYGQQSPPGAAKVILLMTDGGLDVHRDPQYLPDWQVKAQAAVAQQLKLAQQLRVQMWPLGFGSIDQHDQNYLNYMAASGAMTSCGSRSVHPQASIVQDPANALAAMRQLYAAVGCYGLNVDGPVTVGSGRTLHLTIPPIASAAAISVDKGAAGITVGYTMPDGTPVTGASLAGSTFERSGQQTPVDVLRITNPQPGSWTIKLTAPPNLTGELVSAAVFWQGAVRDLITASPPSAQPGEPIQVTLSVLSQQGLITDPATLKTLQVAANVSGDGVA
jgi:von Willebrand factor type A domain